MAVHIEPSSLALPPPPPPLQTPASPSTKKRKGKAPTPNQIYKIKHRLSDEEAKKIAPSIGAPPMPIPSPPSELLALLEAMNKEVEKMRRIQWLRKRNVPKEEGKKTSSVVIYLVREMDVKKVKLSGWWYKSVQYELERGQK
ncbi:hypothetical protein BDZ91DRAFT_804463 [Kalaharituber pfeilii]|nr:hypothetical protein BDZ91DRAFT_804463 [Kalaharituber pfeilii]